MGGKGKNKEGGGQDFGPWQGRAGQGRESGSGH